MKPDFDSLYIEYINLKKEIASISPKVSIYKVMVEKLNAVKIRLDNRNESYPPVDKEESVV